MTLNERRRLEVARTLAFDPKVVLLGEVMAGLNQTEVQGMIELVSTVNAGGLTFLVIEHNLKVVRQFSHRVAVLHRGAKLVEEPAEAVLAVERLSAGFGDVPVLHDVSLHVDEGKIVATVGANGAGKSTLLSSIAGLLHPASGRVLFRFRGADVTGRAAHQGPGAGLALVPEGGRLFPFLSVEDNLLPGGYSDAATGGRAARLDEVMEIYPDPAGAPGATRRQAVGRGAADVRRGARHDEPAVLDDAGRAVDRPLAADGGANPVGGGGAGPARAADAAAGGRAERRRGVGACEPGLRARSRQAMEKSETKTLQTRSGRSPPGSRS